MEPGTNPITQTDIGQSPAEIKPNPIQTAVDKLGEQLKDPIDLETIDSAIEAIKKEALIAEDIQTKVAAITKLGSYASRIPPFPPNGYEWIPQRELENMQRSQEIARNAIAAIFFDSADQVPIQMAAVIQLSRALSMPSLNHGVNKEGVNKISFIQLIAIIANSSKDLEVKNTAVEVLTSYALLKEKTPDQYGGFNAPMKTEASQKFANRATVPASK